MNAVIYCRVSSKEQVEGTSLDTQLAACIGYAKTKRLAVVKQFVEQGESAKFADRTQLLELIDYCRQRSGSVQTLIVYKLDRFARNVADHYSVKATLLKYGVSIVSVTEPIDANPEGKLMETILAGFAQFDNDIRAIRTVQGMKKRLADGIVPWSAPLGYKPAGSRGDRKTSPDQADPVLFPLLQSIWKEFATGAYTKAEIRRLMAATGVRTRRGNPPNAQFVDEFFRNRFYMGILVDPWTGEEREGIHQPMVSKEDFARVQAVIARRNKSKAHARDSDVFMLRGWARCQGCHHYLTASLSKGRTTYYPYYHCLNKGCERYGKSLKAAVVHDEFIEFLSSLTLKESLAELVCNSIADVFDNMDALDKSARQQHAAIKKDQEQELSELIRMRARERITDEEFEAARTRLFVEQAQVAPPTPETRKQVTPTTVERVVRLFRNPIYIWQCLRGIKRTWFQRILLPLGFVVGQIRTAQTGLSIGLFGVFSDPKSGRVALTPQEWNQFMLELQGFSELFEDSDALSEEVKAMFQQKKKRWP